MVRDPRGYYRLFRVTPDASMEEIKRAYRRLAQKLHPDKSTLPNSNEIFQYIVQIHTILISPEKRREYDPLWNRRNTSPLLYELCRRG